MFHRNSFTRRWLGWPGGERSSGLNNDCAMGRARTKIPTGFAQDLGETA
jgi:hypothetical protein